MKDNYFVLIFGMALGAVVFVSSLIGTCKFLDWLYERNEKAAIVAATSVVWVSIFLLIWMHA